MTRKIIHLDMDCFYAAVEVRDHPALLRGKPVGVGGSSRRGVLTTCNYEARKFGCRSAMPTYKALQLCPELIVVPLRFDVYRHEAQRIRAIMHEFTDKVEPLSLDEAFLDVTELPRYAWDIAKEIRERIFRETGLTASAGIAPNKLLAKIASDWKKPNGQFAVRPEEIEAFMKPLPARKLWGIGPKTNERLLGLGFSSCGDLSAAGLTRLQELFGENFGGHLFDQSRGIDEREVEARQGRKSMSVEWTYDESLETDEECQQRLLKLVEELEEDFRAKGGTAKIAKLLVRLKFDDFEKTSRECVGQELKLAEFQRLLSEALLRRDGRPVRLIGVGLRFKEESEDALAPRQMEFEFDARLGP